MPAGILPPIPFWTALSTGGWIVAGSGGVTAGASNSSRLSDDAVGAGLVERVAGAAVGHEQVLALLQVGGDALRRGLLAALAADRPGGDQDREQQRDDAEHDEGAALIVGVA